MAPPPDFLLLMERKPLTGSGAPCCCPRRSDSGRGCPLGSGRLGLRRLGRCHRVLKQRCVRCNSEASTVLTGPRGTPGVGFLHRSRSR